MEVIMPYCTASDGVRIYYEDFGEGPPIVFTCCGVQTHKMWENQVAGLSDRFRVITYDWRGTGDSDKPRSGYTAANVASDLVRLVESLNIAPATLVGHGIGAQVVLLATTARPDIVSKMVLVSAGPWVVGNLDGVGGMSEEFIDYWGKLFYPEHGRGMPHATAYADLGDNWLFHRPPHPAVGHTVLEQALAWPQYVSNAYVKDFTQIDSRERLKMVNWPTLLIQGRHDRKQRYEGALYLERHISGARLHTLEESAHMGQVEEINQFNAAVADFVAQLKDGRQAA
jgi:pimeloyl-ACP methyl ester carboxylesterase